MSLISIKDPDSLTPSETVKELDKFIVGQGNAKRAVAIALRNRWRRQRVTSNLRDEIHPKNILMIGPTGVGKTEIARRLAKLTKSPFLKVEATKYTEVGYVGKDVESMIRELLNIAINMVKKEERVKNMGRAKELAEERLLDILVPNSGRAQVDEAIFPIDAQNPSREKFRSMLHLGELDNREVELKSKDKPVPNLEVLAVPALGDMDFNIQEMLGNMMPKKPRKRKMRVKDALKFLEEEEANRLVDMDQVIPRAIELTEKNGIIFLDEMDKIAETREKYGGGPNISREGVQRDLLPIVEGSNVNTKHGVVKTDHILFIGAGAFHQSKPSDLIPELQGRFPIRVELNSLTQEDFVRILKEPENSLIKQYAALLNTEEVTVTFREDAITSICALACEVNDRMENIGARRLHTILERILEEVSFSAPEIRGSTIEVTEQYVKDRVVDLIKDHDLSRYIL